MIMTRKPPVGSRWGNGDFGGFAAKFRCESMVSNPADWVNDLFPGFFF